MKTLALFSLSLLTAATLAQAKPSYPALQSAGQGFIENKGQWDSHAKFLLQKPGLNMWITSDGAILDAYKVAGKKKKGDVVRMRFAGALPQPEHGLRPLDGYFNYFVGSDKTKWASHVLRYGEVQTGEIYKGIALRYYTDHGSPRYDLIVKPGADPRQVAMKFDGAEGVRVASDGTLKIKTKNGLLEEKGLVAYQFIDNKKTQVACRIKADGKEAFFQTGSYDRTKPLIIDPLIFSSYFYQINSLDGLSTYFCFKRITVDQQSNILLTGDVPSNESYPTTSGAYQTTFVGKNGNAVLAKISSNGSKLLFSTFLGGTTTEEPGYTTDTTQAYTVLVNSDDTISIAGSTLAFDFPTTAGAYYTYHYQSGTYGYPLFGYIATFNSEGSSLNACTEFPASASYTTEDEAGNFWFIGLGESTVPITSRNSQGYQDGGFFVAEISPDLRSLLYSRYFHGCQFYGATTSGIANTCLSDLAVKNGQVYITGGGCMPSYRSGDGYYPYPTTAGALFQSGLGFLIHLDTAQDEVIAATDLPTTGTGVNTPSVDSFLDICCTRLAVNSNGNLVLAFPTQTPGLPSTNGSGYPKKTYVGDLAHSEVGYRAMYAMVLGPDLTTVKAAGYFGGTGDDLVGNLQLDKNNNVFITGGTNSQDFPTTPGSIMRQAPLAHGVNYLMELSLSLSNVQFSTLLPGTQPTLFSTDLNEFEVLVSNGAISFSLDPLDNVFLFGSGTTTDFPVSPNAVVPKASPASAEWFMKMSPTVGPAYVSLSKSSVLGGQSITCNVSLVNPAPTGGLTIPLKLTADTTTCDITAPTSFSIPGGSKTGSFQINTAATLKTQEATIELQFPGGSQFVIVNGLPPQVQSATLSPNPVEQNAPFNLTVKLNVPATSAYQVEYTLPPLTDGNVHYVYFQAGSSSATVQLTGDSAPGTNQIFVHDPKYTTLNGPDYFNAYLADRLNYSVTANAVPDGFTVSKISITGGVSDTGTVTLNGPVPSGGETLSVTSNNSAVAVPSSIAVASGATSVSVPITTVGVATVQKVTLSATISGVTSTATLYVAPAAIQAIGTTWSTMPGNAQQPCTVQLNGLAPSVNVGIRLASSNTNVATVPSSLIIYDGNYVGKFTVTSLPVTANTQVTISATLGTQTKSTTLTVTPSLGIHSLSFAATTAISGQVQTGTLVMSQNAASNINVSLSSTNGSVGAVPSSVLVKAGTNTATFGGNVQGVSASTLVTVTASMNGSYVTTSFTVVPATLSALSPVKTSLSSGQSTPCSVYLNGWPPSGGAVVNLSSTSGASVPASVTIPAGSNHTSFTIQGDTVSTSTQVTITATYSGVSKATTITVNP